MLLFLVRLASALQSLDGCQDLIKLITAVSQCRGFSTPTPICSPLTLKTQLEKKGEKALRGPRTAQRLFRFWSMGSGKAGTQKMLWLFSFLCKLYF